MVSAQALVLLAIGLSGFAVALAAFAYAWNGFANLVNPLLSVLRIPRVPTFPVCFVGQQNCGGSLSAQARLANPDDIVASSASSLVEPAGRGVATSKRVAGAAQVAAAVGVSGENNTTATNVRATKQSTASASGMGSSKRGTTTVAR